MVNFEQVEQNESVGMWPTASYHQYVGLLKEAINKPVYILEMTQGAVMSGAIIQAQPLVLLAVIDFPRPDPYRQLAPHLLILEDGRGINLGRVARVSIHSAFQPTASEVLFQNDAYMAEVLLQPRTLSKQSLRDTSQEVLAQLLGKAPTPQLGQEVLPKLR